VDKPRSHYIECLEQAARLSSGVVSSELLDWIAEPDRANNVVGPTVFAAGSLATCARKRSTDCNRALVELLARLSHIDSDDRFGHGRALAAVALGELTTDIAPAVASIAKTVALRWIELYWEFARDDRHAVLWDCSSVLAALGRADPMLDHVAADALVELDCGVTESREETAVVAGALAQLGPRAVTSQSASLIAMLADADAPTIAYAGIHAIEDLAPALDLDSLRPILADKLACAHQPGLGQAAARAFSSFGQTEASESVVAWVRAKADAADLEPTSRSANRTEELLGITEALARLTAIDGDAASVRSLVRLTSHHEWEVRSSATDWLGLVREPSARAEVSAALWATAR
jgi:hypothetical protein